MTEKELNTILETTPDPEKNMVNINDRYYKQEIERIINIFQIIDKEKKEYKLSRIKTICNEMCLSYSDN